MEPLKYATVYARLKRGWSKERATTEPIRYGDYTSTEKRCSRCKKMKLRSEFIKLARRNGREWSAHCRECDRKRCKKMRVDLRKELIAHYSKGKNCCAVCGENRLAVLDLDHIKGGGIEHRKQFPGQKFYYALRRQGFPKGLRVLCRNCNWLAWIKRKGAKKCRK